MTCISETFLYDEIIVPLLQRMNSLEKLALYFETDREEQYIDGNALNKDILNDMMQLNEFLFSIQTTVFRNKQISLITKKEIDQTFANDRKFPIIACVSYFSERKLGQCHIYSFPYPSIEYSNITNHFPGGLFPNVQTISLHDEHPFEHAFFLQIAQSFPFLRSLQLHNSKKQKFSSNNDQLAMSQYSHLTKLHFVTSNDDYLEEFLFDTKTSFSQKIRLICNYEQFKRVTRNFTSDRTRHNCSKIQQISLYDSIQMPDCYRHYFPHLE